MVSMSKCIWFSACAVLLAWVPVWADEDPAKADRSLLKGTWELADQAPQGTGAARRTLEVKGDTFIFRSDEKPTRQVVATFQATKQPKAIDLKEDGEAKPFLAIYQIEKDRLTLCIAVEKARPTDTRPTAFEAQPGQVLVTYTRVKR
jgi:uncharacterized protein (TIGR03067 family)